jgi:hypothetical protein
LLNTDSSGETVSPPGTSPTSPVAPTPPGQSGSDQSDDKFYLIDSACVTSVNGVMGGKSFALQVECCTNILDFDSRKSCCDESVASPADQLRCLLEDAADPVEVEQFYFSSGKCYSSFDGVMDGQLYASREKCCATIGPLADKHACLWNQSGPNSQPNAVKSAPSSAYQQLARGSYFVAALVCLGFQFIM